MFELQLALMDESLPIEHPTQFAVIHARPGQ
jgi:hypothetical protein